MDRCLLCRMWKPIWKWVEEVDRLTEQRFRLGGLCRSCHACRTLTAESSNATENFDRVAA